MSLHYQLIWRFVPRRRIDHMDWVTLTSSKLLCYNPRSYTITNLHNRMSGIFVLSASSWSRNPAGGHIFFQFIFVYFVLLWSRLFSSSFFCFYFLCFASCFPFPCFLAHLVMSLCNHALSVVCHCHCHHCRRWRRHWHWHLCTALPVTGWIIEASYLTNICSYAPSICTWNIKSMWRIFF